jgi:hypothetical protein
MFFSVKVPLRIAGKDYIPCVCYPLPRFLEYTVKELKKEGKVEIYDKMVFFQNGKLVEKTEPKPVTVEVKPKKEKKAKTVPVANVEDLAKEAEIVPAEEATDDEAEGF